MNKKYDIDIVIKQLGAVNLKIADPGFVYEHCLQKIPVICPQGHLTTKTMDKIKQGRTRCRECSVKSKSVDKNNVPIPLDVDKFLQFKQPWMKKLENLGEGLALQECFNGHLFKSQIEKVRKRKGCGACLRKANSLASRLQEDDMRSFILSKGQKPISYRFQDTHRWEIECENKHVYEINIQNFKKGHRCPFCFYKKETACRDLMEGLFKCKFPKARPDFMNGLELDGYNDILKIAFEYDGEQHFYPMTNWGGVKRYEAQIKRDREKDLLCKKNGVLLIRIPYFIVDREDYVKKCLLRHLSDTLSKERKCHS